ncbi:MAG: alpha-hydroxy acid oxidase [Chloroflexi bacterium]|nr:alpha-hydroxy acid oxidase [Chloroflexota bacterium]
MPHNMWDFVDAACNDEITKRRNREAFDRITVNSDFLQDVSKRDLTTTVLGEKISFPVMVAPTGGQRQAHPEGEKATAMGAGAAGTLMALATSSGWGIDEVAEVATGPLWWQLYHFNDEVTEILVKKAKNAGFKAICLTIDTPSPSPKERDLRNGYVAMPGLHWGSLRERPDLTSLRSVGVPDMADWNPPDFTGLTWDRLDWLRDLTGLPLVIKGVRTVREAVQCAEHGVDGIVVSNHGGRQMDGTKSTIESLVPIADAVGSSNMEIYLDSGVRRGLDVVKALALGARAVMVGRPLYWGLAYDGANGVETMLNILKTEFDRAMAYVGKRTPAEIDRSVVELPCQCWEGSPIFNHSH